MTNGKFNSEQIVLKVREYFEKIRGTKAFNFNVYECKYDSGTWIVVCSFVANPFIGSEFKYEVKVSGDNGDILGVRRITE